LLLIS